MPPARTSAEGLDRVRELVARFARNESHYMTPQFDETSVREQYIDPFFAALGWDVTDEAGAGPLREIVFHRRVNTFGTAAGEEAWDEDLSEEELAARGPQVSIPDYAFITNGILRMYVEAKTPHAGLQGRAAAYQVKSYAWAERLPVSVLTDFRGLRIFDTRNRPEFRYPLDGLLSGWDLVYSDYPAQWDRLWAALSRDNVASGKLYRLVGTAVPRGWLRIDQAFLQDLARWREELAQDLLDRNRDLDRHAITEATQRILDRLVFLRVVEDRLIEPAIVLRKFARITDSYRHLTQEFRRLDAAYNGQLFAEHFSERLEVSDSFLQRLIEGLYPPRSPYRFAVVSADILGAVYERFLGDEVVIVDGRAKVAEKPEVRHSGGVYYTPEWVVRHIVETTLAPLTADRTPRTVAQLRILDPACGSGSFLLGAFDYLINWHEKFYTEHPEEDKRQHYEAPDGHRRLTMEAKTRLLTRCIYGVDIDPQAVEVAQMSLYLRVLDFETQATLLQQIGLFPGALLPPLSSNIRSGNTLLAPNEVPLGLLDDDERARRINPFDWADDKFGFGTILKERGGFDAIIGNPPYTRVQVLKQYRPEESALYEELYSSAGTGSYDIAMLFVERCLKLLRQSSRGDRSGRLCFIISRQFAETDAGTPLRSLLTRGGHVVSIVDFGSGLVFGPKVGAYTLILNLSRSANAAWTITRVPSPPSADAMRAALDSPVLHAAMDGAVLASEIWTLSLPTENALLARLGESNASLKEVSGGAIYQGVVTGADGIFRVADVGAGPDGCRMVRPLCLPPSAEAIAVEENILRPVYAGRSAIGRFVTKDSGEWLILPYTRRDRTGRYVLFSPNALASVAPRAFAWLKGREVELRRRSGTWTDLNWFAYSRRQNLELFDSDEKVLVPYMVEDLCAVVDAGRHFFVNVATGGYGIGLEARFGISREYLAALLNSELLSWILRRYSRAWRGGWFAARAGNLEKLPIAVPERRLQAEIVGLYQACRTTAASLGSTRRGSADQDRFNRLLAAQTERFDSVVAGIYAITAAELQVVRSIQIPRDVVTEEAV